MDNLVSIIIPVYNVEKFLDKCVESVVNQTYTNLEIILVDDGTRDDSGIMCDRWQKEDKRIKVLHQENGGLAHARNEGMKLATGQYVLFVDSDDWIDRDMVETLLKGCVENDAQIAICRYRGIYKDHIVEQESDESFVCSGEEALKYHVCEKEERYCFCYAVWNKLYKREIITGIKFPKGKHFEDVGYTSKVLYSAKRVYYIDKPMYNYVIERKGSIMNEGFTARKVTDELQLLDKEIDFFHAENLGKYADVSIEKLLEKIYIYYWCVLRSDGITNKEECIDILKRLHFKYKDFYSHKRGITIERIKSAIFERVPIVIPLCYGCVLKIHAVLKIRMK